MHCSIPMFEQVLQCLQFHFTSFRGMFCSASQWTFVCLFECQLVHATWSYGFIWLDGNGQNLYKDVSNWGGTLFASKTAENYSNLNKITAENSHQHQRATLLETPVQFASVNSNCLPGSTSEARKTHENRLGAWEPP